MTSTPSHSSRDPNEESPLIEVPKANGRTPLERRHSKAATFPLYHSSRKKPRRWPLVLRFVKGAMCVMLQLGTSNWRQRVPEKYTLTILRINLRHDSVFVPVLLHATFAVLIVYLDNVKDGHLGLPSSTIPSLSIVVGLMLVFRNQTSYDRFWKGNQHFTQVSRAMRSLRSAKSHVLRAASIQSLC